MALGLSASLACARRTTSSGTPSSAPTMDAPVLTSSGDSEAPVTGDTLTCTPQSVAGSPSPSIDYQWQKRTNSGAPNAISGETTSTFTVADGYVTAPASAPVITIGVQNTPSVGDHLTVNGAEVVACAYDDVPSNGFVVTGPDSPPSLEGIASNIQAALAAMSVSGVSYVGTVVTVTGSEGSASTITATTDSSGLTLSATSATGTDAQVSADSYRCRMTASNGVSPDAVDYTPWTGDCVG